MTADFTRLWSRLTPRSQQHLSLASHCYTRVSLAATHSLIIIHNLLAISATHTLWLATYTLQSFSTVTTKCLAECLSDMKWSMKWTMLHRCRHTGTDQTFEDTPLPTHPLVIQTGGGKNITSSRQRLDWNKTRDLCFWTFHSSTKQARSMRKS